MAGDPGNLGRFLIVAGVVLAIAGIVVNSGAKVPWLGKLPGDIALRRENFSFYFPLATCIVVSALISIVAWIFGRFR